MMPLFFEPTAKKWELSLAAAGRSRSCGNPGKPKAGIWRPPRHLGSRKRHHTAFAGAYRAAIFLALFRERFIAEGASLEGDFRRESRKAIRRKPFRYETRGICSPIRHPVEETRFFAPNRWKNKVFNQRSPRGPGESFLFFPPLPLFPYFLF